MSIALGKAGPTLYGVFGRRVGTVERYAYSEVLVGCESAWSETTIDAILNFGLDHFLPSSKMPMQIIDGPENRADLIAFLKRATREE
ncbi:MAG: hypothetical protein AAF636_24250 [Pseudomonadota bacterium]